MPSELFIADIERLKKLAQLKKTAASRVKNVDFHVPADRRTRMNVFNLIKISIPLFDRLHTLSLNL